jgi:hypothetical protein
VLAPAAKKIKKLQTVKKTITRENPKKVKEKVPSKRQKKHKIKHPQKNNKIV